MISSRIANIETSGIRLVFEKASKMRDVIRLDAGEPDFETPQHIQQAAYAAMKNGLTHYTSSYGLLELRQVISQKLRRDNHVYADPESQIVVTSGASSAFYLAMLGTIDKGDEVLIPDPCWPHVRPCVALAGGVAKPYPLLEHNNFQPRPEDVEARVSEKTKMVVLNSPSNPTGAVSPRSAIRKIADIVAERELLLLSDEVYEKIIYDEEHASPASFADLSKNIITINSFSKTYAMTGWRLGYLVAEQEIAEQVGKLNLYLTSCPSSVAQHAGLAALTGSQECVKEMVGEYRKRRDFLLRELDDVSGLTCVRPGGAFYLFINAKELNHTSSELARFLLEEARVASIPGSAFGENGEGYLRLSYTAPLEKLRSAVHRVRNALSRIQNKYGTKRKQLSGRRRTKRTASQ